MSAIGQQEMISPGARREFLRNFLQFPEVADGFVRVTLEEWVAQFSVIFYAICLICQIGTDSSPAYLSYPGLKCKTLLMKRCRLQV